MNFRASFCDPFKKDIIELGEIQKSNIMEAFKKIPWDDYLERMKHAKGNEIYYSPSLEIENKDNRNGLCISAVEGDGWYIFYKRPKLVKLFFGLVQRMNNNYTTEKISQSENDVRDCLNALINNDLDFLEKKIK